jgi:hypothetical protein
VAEFQEQLEARVEEEIDKEFIEKGRSLGFDPVSVHELRDAVAGQDLSRDGEEQASPFANLPKRDQRAINRLRSIGQRRTRHEPEPEAPKPAPKNRRRQIMVQYNDIPIDLVDERTGDTVTVFMRSVPTTELPYLDRHDMMLQRIRQQLSQLTGRDAKTQRRVETLSQEYNDLSEEMTRFVIEMPDGLYERLNVPTLRALQAEIQRMVTGSQVADQLDEDDTNPNW